MIDWNLIAQGCIAALLLGAGKLLYNVSVAVIELKTELKVHTRQDEQNFRELKELARS